jgi:hypothetical protein
MGEPVNTEVINKIDLIFTSAECIYHNNFKYRHIVNNQAVESIKIDWRGNNKTSRLEELASDLINSEINLSMFNELNFNMVISDKYERLVLNTINKRLKFVSEYFLNIISHYHQPIEANILLDKLYNNVIDDYDELKSAIQVDYIEKLALFEEIYSEYNSFYTPILRSMLGSTNKISMDNHINLLYGPNNEKVIKLLHSKLTDMGCINVNYENFTSHFYPKSIDIPKIQWLKKDSLLCMLFKGGYQNGLEIPEVRCTNQQKWIMISEHFTNQFGEIYNVEKIRGSYNNAGKHLVQAIDSIVELVNEIEKIRKSKI